MSLTDVCVYKKNLKPKQQIKEGTKEKIGVAGKKKHGDETRLQKIRVM